MTIPLSKKFVVVSGYFPPIVGGTSTVMRNLLSAFKPESYSVVAESPSSFGGVHNAPVPEGVSIERVGVPAFVMEKIPYGARLARWLRFGMIPSIERKILAAKPGRIVAVYPSWSFLIAAYRAHLRSGAPLFTYYMDVSIDASRLAWPDRLAVRCYEQNILCAASQRLVLSEAIAVDFQERFGFSSIVIPHTIDLAALPAAPQPPPQVQSWKNRKLIVHTGVVEASQREGLLRLAKVIHTYPELNARLVLSTPTSHSDLRASGFDLPWVEVCTVNATEVIALQRAADVLVAVLPFHRENDAHQRTAFPTKVVEYMAAGVPILAHAPGESFFARHIKTHGYALLADEPNEASLYFALARLLDDEALRKQMICRARLTVESYFDLGKVAPHFAEVCGIDRLTQRSQ